MHSLDSVAGLIQARRRVLQEVVGRSLLIPEGTEDPPLSSDHREHLFDELRDLYWNDLEWENVTGEEEMEGGAIPELIFPGVLALTRGLLLTEVPSDFTAVAQPRPEVVEQFVGFLAERIIGLREIATDEPGEEGDRGAPELRMTEALLDRVLMEYHRLSPEDVGTLEGV